MVGLVFGCHNAIVCVPIIGLRLVVRLILRVGPRIVKRNLAQRDPVEALQGLGTRFCILGRILAAAKGPRNANESHSGGSAMR